MTASEKLGFLGLATAGSWLVVIAAARAVVSIF